MITKRQFLRLGVSAAAVSAVTYAALKASREYRSEAFEFTLSDAEWKKRLTEDQYLVLRREATETPNSSPLNTEPREGTYHCAGCDLAVYASDAKYDSGTGWPSFTASLQGAVRTKLDLSIVIPRTEVHCRRCGGHLGHIFDDGPPPAGKRHCLNGVALQFKPSEV